MRHANYSFDYSGREQFQSRRAGDHPCDETPMKYEAGAYVCFNPDVREIIRATATPGGYRFLPLSYTASACSSSPNTPQRLPCASTCDDGVVLEKMGDRRNLGRFS